MGPTSRQYCASLTCGISGAMALCTLTWLEPLVEQMTSEGSLVPMTPEQTSWLVSSIELGELVSTLPAGILADRFGRKAVLLSAGWLSIFSWLLVITTQSVIVLFIVRLIQGAVVGVAYTVAPMYIAEISEPRIRGELTGHFQTLCMFGVLFVYLTGPLLTYLNYTVFLMVVSMVFILLFSAMPESPYYLLMSNQEKHAEEALRWLRSTDDIGVEYQIISKSVSDDLNMKAGWKDLLRTKKDRKAFLIVQVVCLTKFMNGRPPIYNYATRIFDNSSNTFFASHHLTIILGVILCITSFGAAFMTDTIGRRKLLIYSTLICALFNLITGGYCYLSETGYDVSSFSWVLILSVLGFCSVSNLGLGSLMGTIQAELFPSHTRGIGGGITGITASIGAFVSLKQFQTIQDWAGVSLNFWIFAVVGLLGTIIMYFVIPETAGKSLSDIQKLILPQKKTAQVVEIISEIFENCIKELEHTKL